MSMAKHLIKGKVQLYVVVSYSIQFHNAGINTSSELTRTNFPRSNVNIQRCHVAKHYGNELLYLLERLALIHAENIQRQLFQCQGHKFMVSMIS